MKHKLKHKFILLLLAVITGLSILNGVASFLATAPNPAEPSLWARPAEQTPVLIAGNSRGGKDPRPTLTP